MTSIIPQPIIAAKLADAKKKSSCYICQRIRWHGQDNGNRKLFTQKICARL